MTLEITKRNELFFDPIDERANDLDKNRNRQNDRKFSSDRSSISYYNDDRKSYLSDSNNEFHSDDAVPDSPRILDEYSNSLAPPIDILDRIKGYEMVSFDTTSVPPPPGDVDEIDGHNEEIDEIQSKVAKPILIVQDIGSKLTEQQARAALLAHISNQCCYGRGTAKKMTILSMDYLAAYHYELQTFTEKRETAWTFAPMRSGYDTTPSGQRLSGFVPPLPWEIDETPSQSFKEEVRLIEVPHTACTKTCHRCKGTGGVVCRDCNGKGWVRCLHCHGNGWMLDTSGHRERCFYCQHSRNGHGHGHKDCHKCNSKGKVNCQTCEGYGQIRCFIQLSITWKVHTADHIVERLGLPTDLVRDAAGQVAFEEEDARVKPVDLDISISSSSSDGSESKSLVVKEASSSLVSKHLTAFSLDQKVIRQRHQVRIVPVTCITYEWKTKTHKFFVYGYENKVHLQKYPQTCCWGCLIM